MEIGSDSRMQWNLIGRWTGGPVSDWPRGFNNLAPKQKETNANREVIARRCRQSRTFHFVAAMFSCYVRFPHGPRIYANDLLAA